MADAFSPEPDIGCDLMQIAAEKHRAGRLDRRTLLGCLMALGGVATTGKASAATGELVVVNFGGPAVAAFKAAFGPAYEKLTGLKLVIDGSGPLASKIRAMVQANQAVWDVCDTSTNSSLLLGKAGLLEPIDFDIVDKSKVLEGFALPYGVANYTYSYVLSYNRKLLPAEPKSWADFWDRKRFPGKRIMSKTPGGQLEAALLAAGVPRDRLYPLDLDLALRKIKEIKDDLIFWESGAQSMQAFRDKEVVMGNIWHTRAALLLDEMKGDFTWTWNEGILNASAWNIPKGNPAGRKAAMQFVASTQDPAQQAALFVALASGPANPATVSLIPPDLLFRDPMQPANRQVQITSNPQWWADNNDRVADLWLDAISG